MFKNYQIKETKMVSTSSTAVSLVTLQYLEQFVKQMTKTDFQNLLRHLDQCAAAFRITFEHEVWRNMFRSVRVNKILIFN